MIVKFPIYIDKFGRSQPTDRNIQWHRYYHVHYMYIKNLLTADGACIEDVNPIDFFEYRMLTSFEVIINRHRILFDYNDHLKLSVPDKQVGIYKCVFKFHYNKELHSDFKNIFPFSPVNFNSWKQYELMSNECKYTATGEVINKQSIAGAAIERRTHVQKLLARYNINTDIIDQDQFLKLINSCMVSVCVPGARNDMLDRGQGQYMFLGACTISPKLITILSWDEPLVSGVHYVECKADYSDLIEKIEWCRNNKQACIDIGSNARQLFKKTSLPIRQIEWIKKCIGIQ